eukprot:PRCOL_00001875-RA
MGADEATPHAVRAGEVANGSNGDAGDAHAAKRQKVSGCEAEEKVLCPSKVNANLRTMQYAMRGELYLKAQAMEEANREVMYLNLGNPQALGQKPFTFNRQVLSLALGGDAVLGHERVGELFPPDVIARAKELLKETAGGSVGSYTDSRGIGLVRRDVADYIDARDGTATSHPACTEQIFLTDGASTGVGMMLTAAIRGRGDGILVPVPQYPLYSALVELHGGTFLGYELDEDAGWGFNLELLEGVVAKARERGVTPRAMVFINPGNPTGQCLSHEMLEQLIRFAKREHLVLMADEVYQSNVWVDTKKFISTRKGECGLRGGYLELLNFHPDTMAMVYKMASVTLCANVPGQLAVSLMVKPPQPGDASYELYERESTELRESLRRRAMRLAGAFRGLEGMTCNDAEGALYIFPQLHLPPRAIAAANGAGRQPDLFYCLELLEETGMCVVPGSGFGQKNNTYHMRATILPPEDRLQEVIDKFVNFHVKFMERYS